MSTKEYVKWDWTQEDINFITKAYRTFDYQSIWNRWPETPRSSIKYRAKALGIQPSKEEYNRKQSYVPNYYIFEEPSRIGSYLGGVIASDGCVYKNSISLSVSAHDIEWIESLASIISPKVRVFEREDRDLVGFRFESKKMVDDLKRVYNITPAKSLTLQPPNLTEEKHIKAFALGLFDGDGSHHYGGKTKNTLYLRSSFGASSEEIVQWMADILPGNLRVEKDARIEKYSKGFWYIRTSGKKAKEIHDFLYDPELPILKRKWNLDWKIKVDPNKDWLEE